MDDTSETFKRYDGLRTLLEQNCMFLGLGKMNQEKQNPYLKTPKQNKNPKQMNNKNKYTLSCNPTCPQSYLILTASLILFPILGAGS